MIGDHDLEMDGSDSESRMARAQQSRQEEPDPVPPSPSPVSPPPVSPPPVSRPPVSPPIAAPTITLAAPPPLVTPPLASQPPTNQSQRLSEPITHPNHSPGSSYPALASPFSRHSGSSVASSSQVQAQAVAEQSTNGDAGLQFEEISDDETEGHNAEYGLLIGPIFPPLQFF